MRDVAEVGQTRHQHHRGLTDAEEYPPGGGIGDAPARPSRQVDRYMAPIAQSEPLQRRRFVADADASGNAKTGSGDDYRTIRSSAAVVGGAGFQRTRIEPRDAGAAAAGDEDLSVVGDGAVHARKS